MSKIILLLAFMVSACNAVDVNYTVRYIDGVTKDNYSDNIDGVCEKMEKRASKLAKLPIVDCYNNPLLIASKMQIQAKVLKHLKTWIENGRKDDVYKKELKLYACSDIEIGKLMLSILDDDGVAK